MYDVMTHFVFAASYLAWMPTTNQVLDADATVVFVFVLFPFVPSLS